ncbi:hypothetical protein [Brachyspira sp.]|uniref:hypothetical protein n=1 Tax=Brachyspira sp. TaxID=1977261 RepID=UPI002634DB59|nr:hypothetical protein [Brachyspira sp.]
MRKVFILLSILFCFNFYAFSKGLPLSTEVTGDDYSWIKGRQMISINLNPGGAIFYPLLFNTAANNAVNLTSLIGVNLGDINKYFDYADAKGSAWYIPSIAYSLFVHKQIAIEVGIGVYSSTYNLTISKENAGKLLEALGQPDYGSVIATDTTFNASFMFMPSTFGVKFYGPKRQFYNAFRFGIDAFFYTVSTENGLTGIKTDHTIYDAALYVSYEIGWNIELFPTKEWKVKPTIDIALLEIGYYVRPWAENVYNTVTGGVTSLTSGFSAFNIPAWNSLPGWTRNIALNVRFALFPRIGFSLRF